MDAPPARAREGPHLVDTDVHGALRSRHVLECLPKPWSLRYASGNEGAGHIGYWNPHGVTRRDVQLPDGGSVHDGPANLYRHFLEPYGVDYAVLNCGNLHAALSPEPDYAAALMSAQNDVIAHDWLGADPGGRLRASLIVSPTDPVLAAREIHRGAGRPGIVQVLMPSAARMLYGQRFYDPIYEAACAHGLPVAIHPGSEGTGISGPPTAGGYPGGYFEWHTDLSGSYQAHLVSLVAEGAFQRFPELRFVLVEGGVFWLPPLLWRLDKNWKALRVSVPWVDRLPSEIVADHVLLTTQPLEEPGDPLHFRQMLAMFPAERMLMFSSDLPHWDGDPPDFAAGRFPGPLRQRVMGETARGVYRLPTRAAGAMASAAAAARGGEEGGRAGGVAGAGGGEGR